jgi:hypothetical protein
MGFDRTNLHLQVAKRHGGLMRQHFTEIIEQKMKTGIWLLSCDLAAHAVLS